MLIQRTCSRVCYNYAVKTPRLPLILLLCTAVLAMRIGGVHVHLHADAHAAPSEVHLTDAGLHDEHPDDVAPHADVEVQVFDNIVAKSGKSGFDGAVLLAVLLFASLLWLPRQAPPLSRIADVTPRPSAFLRPPLRGPPR